MHRLCCYPQHLTDERLVYMHGPLVGDNSLELGNDTIVWSPDGGQTRFLSSLIGNDSSGELVFSGNGIGAHTFNTDQFKIDAQFFYDEDLRPNITKEQDFVIASEHRTVKLVHNTIALYDSYGQDAFAMINSMQYNDADLYPFVSDTNAVIVSHGAYLENINSPSPALLTGEPSFDVAIERMKHNGSIWISYVYKNPANNDMEQNKRTYLVLHDGYVFGSGYYSDESLVTR